MITWMILVLIGNFVIIDVVERGHVIDGRMWRTIKNLDNKIYILNREGDPVIIRLPKGIRSKDIKAVELLKTGARIEIKI